MNGKKGDDAILDIVNYHASVFSPEVDLLIAEIVALGGKAEIQDEFGRLLNEPRSTPIGPVKPEDESRLSEYRTWLQALRDQRVQEGREAGWEVDRLLEEARRERKS